MKTQFIISLPYASQDEFEENQKVLIKEVISALLKPKEQEQEYLTRKEVASLLKISLVTLHSWCKTGKIQSCRIGNRVRFKKADIDKAIEEVCYVKIKKV